jgi:hypothetical protein
VSNFVLSLTSYGPRFKFLFQTFQGIKKQSLQPTITQLNIDITEKNKYLKYHEKLSQILDFHVNYLEDLGPGKKLIPTIERYPDSCIVTIDDDLQFENHLFQELWNNHLQEPNAIIATRWHKPKFLTCGYLAPYKEWEFDSEQMSISDHPFVTAGSGALFPPGSLETGVGDKQKYLKLSFSTDDVWYWYHAILNQTPVRKIEGFSELKYTKYSQEKTLYWDGNSAVFNDLNIRSLAINFRLFQCKIGCHTNLLPELLNQINSSTNCAAIVKRIIPLTKSLSSKERYMIIRDLTHLEKDQNKYMEISTSNFKLVKQLVKNLIWRK